MFFTTFIAVVCVHSILGSASCSTGSCSFRFNNVGHVINVLKIICSFPFHKPAYIFWQIAAIFLIWNFKLLALVYPVKSIFKLNTFCVSDFKFTTRAISEKPRRLSTILRSNTITLGSRTVLNQGWQLLKQIDLDQKQFDLELIIFAEYFLPHRTYSGGE